MQLPSAATVTVTATPPAGGGAGAYAKVDKMDAEEARHLKAQYLIHKVLEEAATPSARPPSRRRPAALARVRARIGVRLKKLRLALRGVGARTRRAARRHLRSLRRLIARGGGRGSSSVKPAATGPGVSSLTPNCYLPDLSVHGLDRTETNRQRH